MPSTEARHNISDIYLADTAVPRIWIVRSPGAQRGEHPM